MNFIKKRKRKIYKNSKPLYDNDIKLFDDVLMKKFKRKKNKKAFNNLIENKNITLDLIFKEFGISIPKGLSHAALERKIANIAIKPERLKTNGVLFLMDIKPELYESALKKASQKKALAIFVDKELFIESKVDLKSCDCSSPVILVDKGTEAFKKHYMSYRDKYNGKVIGITGSVGKTTTKGFIGAVIRKKYSSFVSPVSQNAFSQIAENIFYKLSPSYEVFVQEIGAMKIDSIKTSAEILRPDITVLTNVKPHHLQAYENFENVFRDKMSLIDNISSGGSAVVNFDDENLASYDYKSNVISFGIDTNLDVDYRAINIKQNDEFLDMDIIYDNKKVHIKANITGTYNAYNILAAFAVGKLLNIEEKDIVAGIESYESSGIRQNIIDYGSNTLMIDCFNVTNDTIVNAVKVMEEYDIKKGGRKIAIIGGENTLGKYRVEKTKELGLRLSNSTVDEIVCFGTSKTDEASVDRYGDAKVLYETLLDNGFKNVRLITSFDGVVEYMKNCIHPNDMVLLKCIIYLNMPTAIDKAFGTNISLNHKPVIKKSKRIKDNGWSGLSVAYMKEIYITNAKRALLDSKQLSIPSKLCGENVFGISKGVFAYTNVKSIDFGSSIKMIGIGAFKECTKLKAVEFPDSLMHIMEGAFKNCRNLTSIKFGKGIKQIDKNAFAGCNKLKTVILPKKEDLRIEDGAFPENVNVEYL